MRGTGRQVLAVALTAMLGFLPVAATAANYNNLIGVAQGTAEINGQSLLGQTSVFSGDRVHTGPGAPLTVICGPQESIRFAPLSSAQLTKNQDVTFIGFESGAVAFQTIGGMRARVGQTGVEVLSATSALTLAQLALLSAGKYQVTVLRGSAFVRSADQTVLLRQGQAALVTMDSATEAPQGSPSTGRGRNKAVIVLTVAAINAGIIGGILATEQSKRVSPIVP